MCGVLIFKLWSRWKVKCVDRWMVVLGGEGWIVLGFYPISRILHQPSRDTATIRPPTYLEYKKNI